jgi:hypothetical protein
VDARVTDRIILAFGFVVSVLLFDCSLMPELRQGPHRWSYSRDSLSETTDGPTAELCFSPLRSPTPGALEVRGATERVRG